MTLTYYFLISGQRAMAQNSYAYAQQARDPMTAAMLSMVPGLGQFYNGESRKGILFLDVALINYALLSLIFLAPSLVSALSGLGLQYGMKINEGVMKALLQLHIGSPVSIVVLGMVLAFVAYAVRDAYDHAMVKRRRALYADSIIELNEATSGAYIFHASLIVSLGVMALFFFIPKPVAPQITVFEFFTTAEKHVTPPVKSRQQSTTNNEAKSSKLDTTKPINKVPPKAELSKQTPTEKPVTAAQKPAASAAAAAHSSSSAAAQNQAKPVQPQQSAAHAEAAKPTLIAQAFHQPTFMPVPHQPAAVATPSQLPTLQKVMSPAGAAIPSLLPKTMSTPGTALPLPMTPAPGMASSSPSTLPSQIPVGSLPRGSGSPAMPAMAAASSGANSGFQLPGIKSALTGGGPSSSRTVGPIGPSTGPSGVNNTGAPGPINIPTHSTGSGTGPSPEVVSTGRNGPGKHAGPSGDSDVPAPIKAGRGHNGDGPIRIVPSAGAPVSGSSDNPLNLAGKKGDDTPESQHNPDFTLYMQEIQRRIKRSWFPPKDMQKRRVKVMFKVHTSGDMSNLRISDSSGFAVADQAALKAVEAAAPFHHLPAYSPENVDIEFTFDYNVFSGM
ncbi:MAG: TonB family protein [Candidatus Obscuribacterales bacterium]|nr:TonB family protein [Candidatus Obscuribacterales bacterium]